MNTLKLRVIKDLSNRYESELKVVANIYPLPDLKGQQVTDRVGLRNFLVPIGPFGTPSQGPYKYLELVPGRYLVEAILPAGEVVQDEVTLIEGAPPLEFDLRGLDSPHEWLSWQHLSGTVPRQTDYNKNAVRRKDLDFSADLCGSEMAPAVPALNMAVITAESVGKNDVVSTLDRDENLAARGLFLALPDLKSLLPGRAPEFPKNIAVKPVTFPGPFSRFCDELVQNLCFDKSTLPLPPGVNAWNTYQADMMPRYYLFASGPMVPPQYSVIPAPWMLHNGIGDVEVECLVHTSLPADLSSPGLDQGYRLSIVVRDSLIGSMLAYLGSGNIDAAATINQEAHQLLWDKVVNPLAAAAGSYVMVASLKPGEKDYWHQWVANLMNWFPWLPDGAIPYAWVLLKSDLSIEAMQQARSALLEGFRRGLPYYSMGVRMLLDGLTMFHNRALKDGNYDGEVEEALKVARMLALRTNNSQPFTSILI